MLKSTFSQSDIVVHAKVVSILCKICVKGYLFTFFLFLFLFCFTDRTYWVVLPKFCVTFSEFRNTHTHTHPHTPHTPTHPPKYVHPASSLASRSKKRKNNVGFHSPHATIIKQLNSACQFVKWPENWKPYLVLKCLISSCKNALNSSFQISELIYLTLFYIIMPEMPQSKGRSQPLRILSQLFLFWCLK